MADQFAYAAGGYQPDKGRDEKYAGMTRTLGVLAEIVLVSMTIAIPLAVALA